MHLEQMNAVRTVDKHRALHVVAATLGAYGAPSFPDWSGFENHISPDPIVSGTCVQRWTFRREPATVNLGAFALVSVALSAPGLKFHMVNTLGSFVNAATFVLERFADRFEKVPHPIAWRHPMWANPLLPEGAAVPRQRSLF
jgi:hypothetical protein